MWQGKEVELRPYKRLPDGGSSSHAVSPVTRGCSLRHTGLHPLPHGAAASSESVTSLAAELGSRSSLSKPRMTPPSASEPRGLGPASAPGEP